MRSKKDPWSVQQRFGFQDDDLKNPNHDEIMIWLDKNIDRLITEDCFYQRYLKYWQSSCEDTIARESEGEVFSIDSLPYDPVITEKTWEYVITNQTYKSKFTVGFVDFLITVQFPVVWSRPTDDTAWRRYENQEFFHNIATEEQNLAFEIKTTIPSLGELIRQVRMYETYLPGISFYVVSADNRYVEMLKSQNIGFVKYK